MHLPREWWVKVLAALGATAIAWAAMAVFAGPRIP